MIERAVVTTEVFDKTIILHQLQHDIDEMVSNWRKAKATQTAVEAARQQAYQQVRTARHMLHNAQKMRDATRNARRSIQPSIQ